MIAIVLSSEARKAFPLADISSGFPDWFFLALFLISGLAFFASILRYMFGNVSFRRMAANASIAVVIVFLSNYVLIQQQAALRYDAPATVVGTIKSIQVMPGGLFSPDVSNVTFVDGSGLAFSGAHSLKAGDVVVRKEVRSKPVYTVQGAEVPQYFSAR